MPEVYEAARRGGVEVIDLPNAHACDLLEASDGDQVAAILHVTC
jgi:hypothetical protein